MFVDAAEPNRPAIIDKQTAIDLYLANEIVKQLNFHESNLVSNYLKCVGKMSHAAPFITEMLIPAKRI